MTKNVVVFNAPWCNTCTPFKKQLTEAGIVFVSASLDSTVDESLSKITGVAVGESVMALAAAFHVRTLPTTVVFSDAGMDVVVGSKLQEVKNVLSE